MTFSERVYSVVSKIPAGKVISYKTVALLAGSPGAARAVGTLMKKNPNPFYKKSKHSIPCHRVVPVSGKIGGYAGGTSMKTKLLRREGVEIHDGKIAINSFWKKHN